MSHSLGNLLEQLDNAEYRRGFVEGHAKDTIAFQIRQLRKMENWDQRKLAGFRGWTGTRSSFDF
jgi:hypothetical protein